LKNDEFSNDIKVLTRERDSARTEEEVAEEKPRSLSHTNAEYAVGLNKRKKELHAKEDDERQIALVHSRALWRARICGKAAESQ
jgi:hypothetical protein